MQRLPKGIIFTTVEWGLRIVVPKSPLYAARKAVAMRLRQARFGRVPFVGRKGIVTVRCVGATTRRMARTCYDQSWRYEWRVVPEGLGLLGQPRVRLRSLFEP